MIQDFFKSPTERIKTMANVYEGTPDGRQATVSETVLTSRFRLGYSHLTNVYEGTPDGRQATVSETVLTSRFRPRYRQLTDEEKALHDSIKAKAAELEALFEQVKAGRYRALGFTALEESVMWTIKELTA